MFVSVWLQHSFVSLSLIKAFFSVWLQHSFVSFSLITALFWLFQFDYIIILLVSVWLQHYFVCFSLITALFWLFQFDYSILLLVSVWLQHNFVCFSLKREPKSTITMSLKIVFLVCCLAAVALATSSTGLKYRHRIHSFTICIL